MKKRGLLIVNHFLNSAKFRELADFLMQAAAKHDIELIMRDNAELLFDLAHAQPLEPIPKADFGIFWDKDIMLGRQLEARGLRLFNSAEAVALCDDKSQTHLALAGRIAMPRTICAPMSFKGVGYTDASFIDSIESELRYPYVIKECFGSFGKQVYFIHSRADAEALLTHMDGTPLLFQEFVKTSIGRDLRINVVGGKVKAAMLRENPDDFRANITNGGKASPYTPNTEQCQMALESCRLLGVEFAGVDLLFGKGGAPLLCEVNSNAHFKSIFECTGVDLAEALIDYIDREIYGDAS